MNQVKNQNQQPYSILEHYYLQAMVKPIARLIMIYLNSNKEGYAPSQKQIATILGVSRQRISRAEKELEAFNMLEIQNVTDYFILY